LRYLKFMIIVFAVVFSAAAIGPTPERKPIDETFGYIKSQTEIFTLAVHTLRGAIDHINPSDPSSIQPVIAALRSCRIQYKKISFFLDYFYPQQEKLFNAPAKKEVEEPSMEVEEPQSLQQIESILFSPNPQLNKTLLENLILVLDESATDLIPLYAGFQATGAQMMESLQLELIRIMTLYITGYDAPELKTGIQESRAALESIQRVTDIFFNHPKTEHTILDSLLSSAIRYTRVSDFDHFNRLTFLKYYMLPIGEQLDQYMRMNGWKLSGTQAFKFTAGNLFRNEVNNGIHTPADTMADLGRTLFFEKALSGNNARSCASCHQPDKYFTDGLVANQKMNGDSRLRRNTPTLLYVACQSAQFWDGRAVTLQEQISDVLQNPDEMNASIPEIAKKLAKDEKYQYVFRDSTILIQIEEALTAYLNTMQPMNSAFDHYMAGDEHAMTVQQKSGFNLFMGKAQCGTCHFAPVFNGSTPPFFSRSEYEVLGVPGIQKSGAVSADRDLGRYERYPISVYRRAFKTPTVRNSAMTGPYMHNGYFKTLHAVIEFYNNGGGAGIGLASPEQTLSEKRLHLSQEEMNDITAFLQSLTDNLKTGIN